MATSPPPPDELPRVLHTAGAVMLGLGSIVGTGMFVGIAAAAAVAGPSVLLAIGLAAVVAICNGLALAQLAAAHPVSGGAYEYGYRYLAPSLGFTAGWMFVCAKTASAATAALGSARYVLALAGCSSRTAAIALGVAIAAATTVLVAGGMTRSSRTNAVLVTITMVSLVAFVVAGIPHVELARLDVASASPRELAHATALVFVAYTGYGRIATLGEEVREPAITIPRAIAITLGIALVVYVAVTAVALGAGELGGQAPLDAVAAAFGASWVRFAVAAGALAAMLGVLLNLVLGVSRVVLAMSRRGDLPRALARVDGGSPRHAVAITGLAVIALVTLGSVAVTWSFSAFSVLIYYALANACALRQPRGERRIPRAVPALGLGASLSLAWWIEPPIWLVGLALAGAAVGARAIARRRS